MSLKIGDVAPDFSLLSDQNKTLRLRDLRGKNVVLYFYPKDNTPGCTKEACDFRDTVGEFSASNTEIIGISKDNAARHDKFKQKYSLPFTLLADENSEACNAYGVINKKTLFGKIFHGIERSTFLIDEKGIIRAIWRKVKVTGHIKQIAQAIQQLN